MLAIRLSKPLAVEFSSYCQTVGNLVDDVAHHRAQFADPDSDWTDGEIWEGLRRVFVKQQGLELEQIVREASIVDHLGVD